MLGIPQWAIGVVVIILVIAGAVMMVRWLEAEFERPDLKSREGDLGKSREGDLGAVGTTSGLARDPRHSPAGARRLASKRLAPAA